MKTSGKTKFDFVSFIERTSFAKIFVLWILLIVGFGLLYHVTSGFTGILVTNDGNKITGMFDYVYYSFITATSTGYGDILPEGNGMRFLSITNIIIGMLMMAVVTSKLVSIKQERLLEKIYHLSFSEKINRNISGVSLFKGESDKIIDALNESDIVDRKTLFSIRMSLSTLKNNLLDIKKEFMDEKRIITIDKVIVEQTLSGIDQSFENLQTIVIILNKNEVSFKNPKLLEDIYEISNIGVQIVTKAKEEFPVFTNKIKRIYNHINIIKKVIMEFNIVDLNNDVEINISLPIPK